MTGSSTTGAVVCTRPAATAAMAASSPSMPILMAAGGMSASTACSWAVRKAGGTGITPVTPVVFWAVRAARTAMP